MLNFIMLLRFEIRGCSFSQKLKSAFLFFVFVSVYPIFSQTEYYNVDTGYQGYGNENINHTTNVPLSSNLLNSTAPSGGYRLSFSWAANNGQEGEACYSGGESASLAFQLIVNGTEFWWAKSPSNQNGVSGDNQVRNGASWVSGTTGNWNMTCNTLAQTPNITAEIQLPTWINSIASIELRLQTVNPNGRGADDGILRLNSVYMGAISGGSCSNQIENSGVNTGYQGYGNENINHTTNVPLNSNITSSTAPSEGYRLRFSWAANNGQEGEACYSGGESASLAFRLLVNGVEFWWAKSPSNQNGESGDNQVRNGASWVSGTTGNWNMTCNRLAQTPNITAEIRLPIWVNSINRIELKLNTVNPNGRGADDGILRLDNITYCKVTNTTTAIDDSFSTDYNVAVSGNVLDNDSDLEGNTQTVNTVLVINPNYGSVVLNSNGSFLYTPNQNFSGSDSFRYRVCDNGSPVACDEAIVTITVRNFSPPDYYPTLYTQETIINGSSGSIDFVVAFAESNGNLPNMIDAIEFRITDSSAYTFNFDESLTRLNGYDLNNSDWSYKLEGGLHKFIYKGNGEAFPRNSISFIGIKATFNSPSNSQGELPLKVTVKSNSGGQTNTQNDNDQDIINYKN
ncbi:hypothetical protein TSEDIMI_80036 [Tenacibaculum sediminilitoris]|uniref:Ig-like domain-containing protein n=1 Tax=Tenacibaculum sediminilitoris TaxID=1820334 RepID=UPI00389569F7